MKTTEQWFSEYGVSHQNETNQQIHFICVPAILFSILGFLWNFEILQIRATYVVMLVSMFFYFRLGFKPAMVMVVQFLIALAIFLILPPLFPLLETSILVFIVAWIGQFVGHKIEGKKPSFLQDLQFLLIGPLWVFLGHKS